MALSRCRVIGHQKVEGAQVIQGKVVGALIIYLGRPF